MDKNKDPKELNELKEKMDTASTNIAIYIDRLKKLGSEFEKGGMTMKEAKEEIIKIQKRLKDLRKKEIKMFRNANRILKEVKDEIEDITY